MKWIVLTITLLMLTHHGFLLGNENKKTLPWDWMLHSSGFMESVVKITTETKDDTSKKIEGRVVLNCDLSTYNQVASEAKTAEHAEVASIHRINTRDFPGGLLITTCYVGAHSEMLSIINPAERINEEVFSVVGSYYVEWALKRDTLWITYDRPCVPDNNTTCETPFSPITISWPPQ